MEESKREVMLAKFKEGTIKEQIEECIKEYANLVNLIPSMKAFTWGKDANIAKFHEGFTHVFESSFDSIEGIAEYISHPHHVEHANKLLPQLEKFLTLDYKKTKVQL